jgi:predicted anti-sigma-YlaC factor YlaD
MDCDEWREAVSAIVDGEESSINPRLVDAHLARCPACRDFRTAAERSRRSSLVQPVDAQPELAARVTKLTAIADRAARWSVARVLLGIVAIEIIIFSLPDLVLGDELNTSAHSARHLGAFTVAYGAGLLVVFVRPARARTMLPVALVLAVALVISAIIDLVNGQIPLISETQHIPELLSVILIWLMTIPTPKRFSRRRSRSGFESIDLHLVDEHREVG